MTLRPRMNTFFYSIKDKSCGIHCDFTSCPHRYLQQLKSRSHQSNIWVLSGQREWLSVSDKPAPRNGDIIILYATDIHELDLIIDTSDRFDGLKKILVVRNTSGIDGTRYHKLSPRFITQAGRSLEELDAVITRMKTQIN